MISAVAFCPAPPVLVPQVAVGAAPELDDVRRACDDALALLLATGPDRLVLVGTADGAYADDPSADAAPLPQPRDLPPSAVGALQGVGVDLTVPLDPGAASSGVPGTAPVLPMSLTVGAWLVGRTGWPGPRTGLVLAARTPPALAAEAGRALASGDGRVGLVVLGEGSACRTEKSPGYVVPGAIEYDDEVTAALAAVDVGMLERLDEPTSTRLLASGRAPWQAAAAAATAAGQGEGRWHGEVLAAAAPYGVAYLVATWRR